jgi:hypothetical protein
VHVGDVQRRPAVKLGPRGRRENQREGVPNPPQIVPVRPEQLLFVVAESKMNLFSYMNFLN